MIDIRLIRDNPEGFDGALARRGAVPASAQILEKDAALRALKTRLQDLQNRRNTASKQIGVLKGKGEDAADAIAEVAKLKQDIQNSEEEERILSAEVDALVASFPNILADDVPDGSDEDSNVELRKVGAPPQLNDSKDHTDLGEALGQMSFERAAKLSGARFVVLQGQLARLERALAQFMLDLHTTEFGYTEVAPPYLVRDEAMFGTGQLPKFAEDSFRTENGLWLIPTSEVSLTNLVREEILDADDLPLRFTALTPCFRSEAGSAGKDTRGMIRQHQFHKVEMVSITAPDQSEAEHERMTNCAEEVLQRLGLAYRVMLLCSGDTGFSACKTYDLEVWMPSEGRYREISSCSNTGDFQARRMRARYRPEDSRGTAFVHTLNGSGVAVGRALIAVMENYQQPDGSIAIPDVLQPYMGGLTRIGGC